MENAREGESAFASDRTWGESAQKSYVQAIKHFNRFVADVSDDSWTKRERNQLFGAGNEQTYASINLQFVKSKMFDLFASYLFHATAFDNSENFLAFNTADRYLSAIKTGLYRRSLKEGGSKLKLVDKELTMIRDGMVKLFVAVRWIELNIPLLKSQETTTKEDMFVVCVLF